MRDDIDYSELEDAVITLENEDGTSIDCSLICIFEYNGQDYAAFSEVDASDEMEVYFFSVTAKTKKDETEFEFSIVEEEDLLDELVELLQQISDQEFEEEDGGVYLEEEEDDDEDDEDSKWDEFITKKL